MTHKQPVFHELIGDWVDNKQRGWSANHGRDNGEGWKVKSGTDPTIIKSNPNKFKTYHFRDTSRYISIV